MRVSFRSSHVDSDFSDGMLTVDIGIEDDQRQVASEQRIFFSVPHDFHAHNDLIAAALMAIMGWDYREAHFNFPISARCSALLPLYHRLEEVGPVDPDLEPRQPGRHLGITFSGGTDSTTLWTMLRDIPELEFKVITGEFDGFYHEAVGYASYHRDVSCWTNFRRVVGDRGRRFDVALPLLFADYLDLDSFATGQTYASLPTVWNDPRGPEPPEFLNQEAASAAGGLREIHIMRCMQTSVVLRRLVATAPERAERALHASAGRGTYKYLDRAFMLRYFFRQRGLPVPEFLRDIDWVRQPHTERAKRRLFHLWTIWHWKHLERSEALLASPQLMVRDFEPLRDLSLDLLDRYDGTLAALIPAELRESILSGFHAAGIEPFDAHDYDELDVLRQFIIAENDPEALLYE